MKNKKRQSNFELLRIVCMLMIILFHIFYHPIYHQLTNTDSIELLNNGYFSNPIFYKRLLLLEFMSPLGQIANGIFIMITGYFLINKTSKNSSIVSTVTKILSQLFFVVVVLLSLSIVTRLVSPLDTTITMSGLATFNEAWWFAGYYIIVMLIGLLFINKYVSRITQDQFLIYLVVLLAIISLGWPRNLLDGFSSGFSRIFGGSFYYLLGGYIKKYNPFNKFKTSLIFVILAFLAFTIIMNYWNVTNLNINRYLLDPQDSFIQKPTLYNEFNIVVVTGAVCIFELFNRLDLRHSKVINRLAQASFMVYLSHENSYIRSFWFNFDWIESLNKGALPFIANAVGLTLLMYIFGFIVFLLFSLITSTSSKNFFRKVFVRESFSTNSENL